MSRRFRVLATIIVLLLAISAGADTNREAVVRDLESFIESEMLEQRIPGLSLAVLHGEWTWARGFGFADLENQARAKPESSYRMASVTKPMTAVGILELVEQGKLNLDAEIHTYVPWYPEKPHPITVRQLLGHLGGIGHYRNYDLEGHFRERMNTREAIAVFAEFDLSSVPGTEYQYSSYGYNLLGAILEAASGVSYGEFMTTSVWKPLGMNDTRMDDPRAIIPHRVEGYTLEGGQLRRSEYVDISSRFAAGGTRSTVLDMIAFVRGLSEGKVLGAEMRELMWTSLETTGGRETHYALGWGVRPLSGRFRVNHSGSQQETRTLLRFLPRDQFAVAIASNLEQADLNRFADRITETFVGELYEANLYAGAERDRHILRALEETFNTGVGYFDRHGQAVSSEAGELRAAFEFLERTIAEAGTEEGDAMSREGAHPKRGRAFTVAGSWMARTLAERDPDVLDRVRGNGPLELVASYQSMAPEDLRLGNELVSLVARWSREWDDLDRDAFETMRFAGAEHLDRYEKPLRATAGRTFRPDFILDLIRLAERSAEANDLATAMRAAKLAFDVYPEHDASNGLYGILLLLAGNQEEGAKLVRRSTEIRKDGYAGPENLGEIATFLLEAGQLKQAIGLLELGADLHPESIDILVLLAQALEQSKQPEKARKVWAKVLTLSSV